MKQGMNLDQTQLKNIENEIEKFESQVDFEFIPVVAQQSCSTEHVPWVLSLVFILSFISILQVIFEYFFYNVWYDRTLSYVGVVILAIVLSRFLSQYGFVQRLFISEKERCRQVHEKAQSIFFMRRLSEVKSKNALLVFVSIMERRIEILPDPRVQMNGLNEMTNHAVNLLRTAFKEQNYEQGFTAVIQYIQGQLREKFPRQAPGENLVSNKLIWCD